MRSTLPLLVLSLWWGIPSSGQSTTVQVSISLASPSPTCSLTGDSSLNYGIVEKPGTGTGSVVVNPITGARTSATLSLSGSSSVGQVRLGGANVSTYTVSRNFPATLTSSGESLTYSGTWARSTSANSGYTLISGASYAGTSSGAGTSFTQYFRFGGTVSNIDLLDANGTYTGTITATAACN